jgi:hypothetical protein
MATATLESVKKNVLSLPDVFGLLSDTVTTYAIAMNQSWPYVTYPGWASVGSHVRGLTNTMVVSLLVNVNDPHKWVEYSQAHSNVDISPVIFQLEPDGDIVPKMDGKEELTVMWEMAFDPKYVTGHENRFYNHNFLAFSYFNQTVHSIQKRRHGLIAPFMATAPTSDSKIANDMKSVSDTVAPPDNPRGAFITPVFEGEDEGGSIVAYIEAIIDWSVFFDNVLLNDDEGIYCTVRNTCGQEHTWLVDASGAKYLGPVSDSACGLSMRSIYLCHI